MRTMAQIATPETAPWESLAPRLGEPWSFLLDPCDPQQPCFAGSNPVEVLVVHSDRSITKTCGQGTTQIEQEPIAAIADFVASSAAEPHAPGDLPRESQAWVLPRTVGYLGYELGAATEGIPTPKRDAVGEPLAILATYRDVAWWDPTSKRNGKLTFHDPRQPLSAASLDRLLTLSPTTSPLDTTKQRYLNAFQRIQAYIRAGEIYQTNLSRRMSFPTAGLAAAELYEQLRRLHPVPHGAFLDYGAFAILCNSPESFLRCDGQTIRTLPIKGTRPRSSDPKLDAEAAALLVEDGKEAAEHLMIVDLERNDLGRIAKISSVCVESFSTLRAFPTLYHLESSVAAELREDIGLADILRATFPGGSITGAPKVRSMQIIAEVEDSRRGVYTGTIGCWNGQRQMNLAMAIRTAVLTPSWIHYSSGGGLVADSQAEAEWTETETKAKAFHLALAAALQAEQPTKPTSPGRKRTSS